MAKIQGSPNPLAEAVGKLSDRIGSVGRAITADAGQGHDATDGAVESLTEAVMGVTAGLVRIADAIESLAEAVRETRTEGRE